jgi:hypothetical protein
MMGKGHTTHVDRINLVPLCIHLINDMSSLKSDSLSSVSYLLPPSSETSIQPVSRFIASPHLVSMISQKGKESRMKKREPTSRAMLNFLAKSFTLSSRVKPVIIPFIFESARGDLFPDGQLTPSSRRGRSYRAILSADILVKFDELTKSG